VFPKGVGLDEHARAKAIGLACLCLAALEHEYAGTRECVERHHAWR
jgi:hypothetical protein